MRTFIASIALLVFSITAFAADMPDYMRDGEITVTLKDGRTYKFSTNEYKVVKREEKKNVIIQVDEKGERTLYDAPPAAVVAGRNTVKVYGGAGPSDLKVSKSATSATIEQDYGAVFGLGYSRQLNSRFSLEAVGLSNKTGLLGVGLSF